ncbi:MAG TPA: VOC family protein [Caulobacteraceae bacterium]|jgi:catechol 2,3-dioxygenase-like lactoylglutathione lyase family enzyme
MIIAEIDAQPTVAVGSLDRAKAFYGEVLGLKPVGPADMGPVQCYLAGRTVIVVYESQFAGTNQATAITWPVGSRFDEAIAELKAKGVAFEHYDMAGLTRNGDVHEAGGMKLAWIRDPDGNIIHIGSFGR